MNNSSLGGNFLPYLKEISLTPLLEKSDFDLEYLKNYCAIFNLSLVSKVIEKVIAMCINENISTDDMQITMQSAYEAFHSSESALLPVQNYLLSAMNRKRDHS